MSKFSEEALRKLKKGELITIIQEQDVKHERHEEHIEDLVAEVRKLTSIFAKLNSELVISKNITTFFVEKTCPKGKAMLGQFSILTDRMCESCRDIIVSLSKPARELSL